MIHLYRGRLCRLFDINIYLKSLITCSFGHDIGVELQKREEKLEKSLRVKSVNMLFCNLRLSHVSVNLSEGQQEDHSMQRKHAQSESQSHVWCYVCVLTSKVTLPRGSLSAEMSK